MTHLKRISQGMVLAWVRWGRAGAVPVCRSDSSGSSLGLHVTLHPPEHPRTRTVLPCPPGWGFPQAAGCRTVI